MKRVISLLAAVMLIVLLAACGGGTSAPRTLRIGVALYQQDDTFISSVARELQRAAQEAEQSGDVKINLYITLFLSLVYISVFVCKQPDFQIRMCLKGLPDSILQSFY